MAAPSPITNYTITAFLQDVSHIVNGITTINYVNHADVAFSKLYFHLYPNAFKPDGWIEIFDVMYTSNPLSYTISGTDQTVLEVDLVGSSGPGQLPPGGNVTLTVSWQVMVPESGDRFGWFHRTDPYEFLAYNMGNWHPIVAVYDDRGWDTKPYSHMGESFYHDVATYDVAITVPEDYIVAATGELQTINIGASTKSWNFKTGPVRDFTWCASPNYETTSIISHSVNVTSYYLGAHSAGGQRVLEVADDCLEIYGANFAPYPWESLAIVEADIWAGGMEYPQLVMIGLPLYSYPEGLSSLAAVTAHEIGHEWIPFTLGTDSYTEPWIDEGFASFAEYVWVEYVYGATERADYRNYDLTRYWEYVNSEGDKTLNQSMSVWQSADWYAYGSIVYAKGALIYDMLRHQLGSATFYEAWQYIFTHGMHEKVRTSTLQAFFEEAVNESLDWFFDPWVYNNGVVTLSFGGVSIQQGISGWYISFQVIQDQPTPVRLRVPIHVNYGVHYAVHWVWIEPQAVTLCSLQLSEFPIQLTLDPDRLLLCQYRIDTAILALSPGSPIPLLIGGALAIGLVVGAVVMYRRRYQS
ncbi:MAG: M1 family metallopeptidase [Promethearchaeota archaeon]